MKKFIKNTLIFILPVIIILVLFAIALDMSGDLISINELKLKYISGEDFLYGPAYIDPNPYYKSEMAKLNESDILVLGTSRSMQFSSEMFNSEYTFYNAGGAISNLYEIEAFIENLGDYKPELLVLGLDQYFFNEQWQGEYTPTYYDASEREADFLGYAYPQLLRDFAKGKFNLFNMFKNSGENVGINAMTNGRGFRVDGSYNYGNVAIDPTLSTDPNFSDTFRRIDTGTNRFQYGDMVSTSSLLSLEETLKYCSDNNIKVVAYLPSYANSVYNKMMDSGDYGYLSEILPQIQDIFHKYGFNIYDFTYMDSSTDEMFYDGFHAGDKVYGEMLLSMDVLSEYIDETAITSGMANSDNPRVMNFD